MPKTKRFGRSNATGRNVTEHFIRITKSIYDSAAWADLSNAAVRIYLEIRRRYYGFNNGEISLSCREAAKVAKCGKGTAGIKFQELIDHGFIKVSRKGLYTLRHATTWILTDEPLGNQPAPRDWKAWQPQKQDKVPVTELSVPAAKL